MEGITMNSIKIISTSTVRSPVDDHGRRVELTPWDLQLLFRVPSQNGLLFHKPKDMTTDLMIHRLKTSLSRALRFFPPIAGRLSRTDNDDGATASFFIDCNNAGAQFVHATADSISISDIVGSPYAHPAVPSFSLNGITNDQGVALPLLAVQVTELKDGVFIGCTFNHLVGDATSFWHFLNSWSEISRGHDNNMIITKLPHLRRWFHDDCPIRFPLSQLEHMRLHRDNTASNFSERIFHFGKERVAMLKGRANSEMGMDGRISSLQAVLAHLWRSIIRSRHTKIDEQEVTFLVVMGCRQRLQQLSGQYFGNALQVANVTMKARDIIEKGIGEIAMEMNKSIGLWTQEKIETTFDHWVANPTFLRMSDFTSLVSIVASSSPRFNVYGNDFGWGRPVAIRSGASVKRNGRIILYPGPESGSIEVHAVLPPQTLLDMEKDVEYMNEVTT